MDFMRFLRRCLGVSVTVSTVGLLAGCASSPSSPSSESTYKFDPLAQGTGGDTGSTAQSSGTQPSEARPAASGDGAQTVSGRILRVGESVTVTFQDLPSPVPPVETTIKEDGTITLIYNKPFLAAGKTVGQLESDIRKAYVPDIFVNMTPTISMKERWFYVDGEVKTPGRQVYLTKMTVIDAIATVGGFTDFARKHRILLIRANGKTYTIDFVKAQTRPELNLEVFPDDRVFVKKRWW
jgi:protein involved in polysaccharide export with SLBB domain